MAGLVERLRAGTSSSDVVGTPDEGVRGYVILTWDRWR